MASNNQQHEETGRQQNRYAHLVASTGGPRNGDGNGGGASNNRVHTSALSEKQQQQQQADSPAQATHNSSQSQNQRATAAATTTTMATTTKAPSLREAAASSAAGQQQQQRQKNYYYQSFSTRDWREQWTLLKERTSERVEEPETQRKLIMLIVCTALLLDNMLYMVIVPIIPDYLRSIGAWSTYTENAKWIRRNNSRGRPEWEQVGGQVVYEGEGSAVGFLFASKAIVQLIANPFSGAIADRIGYEIPMMFGLIVMFLSTMVFACGQTYAVLFLARSLQGVGSAFADTPGIALLADRFTEEKARRRAQGIAIAFISFGCLVAPPFGSVLYQGAGKEVPFILLSLVCLIDGSLLLLVCPPGTFSQIWPKYYGSGDGGGAIGTGSGTGAGSGAGSGSGLPNQREMVARNQAGERPLRNSCANLEPAPDESKGEAAGLKLEERGGPLKRQKSISRRHSMTVSAGGEAPKGTPIEVLLRDPCIACCAGALVVANVSLAFLEPTISIWVKSSMPETEEWQEGMIWLPAFLPHVLGVFATLHFAEKHPQATWKIAASGLIIEALGCLVVPFCNSFWALIVPISIICFGVALIDTAILPTLGFLVDTRFTSVYGNVYAIADISYSLSYAVGPIIAGGIVEAIGFTALNFLIAAATLAYAPSLMMLRTIRDYQPFEADATGRARDQARPFGQFGRAPIEERGEAEAEAEAEAQAEAEPTAATADEAGEPRPGAWSGSSLARATSFKRPNGREPRPQKSVKIVDSARLEEGVQAGTNPFQ